MITFYLLALSAGALSAFGQQRFLNFEDTASPWTVFPHSITRVAVIGAGPSGLQAAAHLVAENLTVRLFERAPCPGGNWFYTEETPAREAYPGDTRNQEVLPVDLPATIYFKDGDDGLSLDDRWKEHWQPRPVWYDLHTNSAAATTELPGVKYPANIPWSVSVHDVQRHIRAYASLHGINSNDQPLSGGITSYSTRVEKVVKINSTSWLLTLQRLERLPESNRIRADFWTEAFDAVIVATGPYTTPHVPAIEGIQTWSKAMQDGSYSMQHSQAYRRPERYAGKAVLIVGSRVSATELARNLEPFARRLVASIRTDHTHDEYSLDILFGFPDKVEIVPEISSFEPLGGRNVGIKDGKIRLANGTVLSGIDEIILATGYRRNTFLPEYVNPGTMDNLHWTGHYIHDPTLAYTTVPRPFTLGRYESSGFAKVWAGKARLPNHERMWQDYVDGKSQILGPFDILLLEALHRKYVSWLNSESLELGGSFVEPLPAGSREIFTYFVNSHWKNAWLSHKNYSRFDDLPSSEWPKPVMKHRRDKAQLW